MQIRDFETETIESINKTSSSLPFALPIPMKWGFATTAAIVRCLQKDAFYRKQLERELKLVLLDHLSTRGRILIPFLLIVSLILLTLFQGVGTVMRMEEWLPLLIDLLYYSLLTGSGKRTLGEAYSNIVPVDTSSRDYFLKNRGKRVIWIVLGVLVPFALKRSTKNSRFPVESLESLSKIYFYFSGKYPLLINKFLSIRYVRS